MGAFFLVRRPFTEPTRGIQNTHQPRPRYDVKLSRLCGLAEAVLLPEHHGLGDGSPPVADAGNGLVAQGVQ